MFSLLVALAVLSVTSAAVTLNAAPDFTGFALSFNGQANVGLGITTPTFVSLPASVDVSPVNGLTYSGWVFPKNNGNQPIIQLGWDSPINSKFYLSNGNVCVQYKSTSDRSFCSNTKVLVDKWAHVAAVVENGKSVSFFINGELDVTRITDLTIFASTMTTNYIGRDRSSFYQGALNEIRVFNAPRTIDQIRAEYNLEPSIYSYDSATLLSVPLNEGFTNTVRVFGARAGSQAFDLPMGQVYNGLWIKPYDSNMKLCCSTGDPHVTNFAGAAWESQRAGSFHFVKTADSFFDSQVYQRRCPSPWTSAKCNAGLALKFYGDVVAYMFDVVESTTSAHHYLKINGVLQGNPSSSGFTVYTSPSGITASWSANKLTMIIVVPFIGTFTFDTNLRGYTNICFQGTSIGANRIGNPNNHGGTLGICGSYESSSSSFVPVCTTDLPTKDCTKNLFGDNVATEDSLVEPAPLPEFTLAGFAEQKPDLYAQAEAACPKNEGVKFGCMKDIWITEDLTLAYEFNMAEYQRCVAGAPAGEVVDCALPCPSNCNGRGECVNGQCNCEDGYSGSGCEFARDYVCFTVEQGGEITDISPITSAADVASFPAVLSKAVSMTDTVLFYVNRVGKRSETPVYSLFIIADRAALQGIDSGSVKITMTGLSGLEVRGTTVDLTAGGVLSWSDYKNQMVAVYNLPVSGTFSLNFLVENLNGVNQVAFGTQAANGDMDIFLLKPSAGPSYTFAVKQGQCSDTCSAIKNCASCLEAAQCGWCSTTKSCTLGRATGPQRGFCPLWRWDNDQSKSRVLSTSFGYPITPFSTQVYLSATDSDLPLAISVDVTDPSVFTFDLVMMIETDSTMSDDIINFQRDWLTLFTQLEQRYSQMGFAMAAFNDFPAITSNTLSYPFKILKGITQLRLDNYPVIQNIFNSLTTIPSGDKAQGNAQLAALLKLTENQKALGLRTNSRKIVAMLTDGPFGTSSINAAYPEIDAVKFALIDSAIIPIFLTTVAHAPSYQALVEQLGFGGVILLSSDSRNFPSAIIEAIELSARQVALIPTSNNAVVNVGALVSTYIDGLSFGTRARFNIPLHTAAEHSAILKSPGFGFAKIEHKEWVDILPLATADSPQEGREDEPIRVILKGSSAYWKTSELKARIYNIPDPSVGKLYQFTEDFDVATATQITSVPTDVTDPLNSVIFFPAENLDGQSLFTLQYTMLDECMESLQGTVVLNVNGVNDAPILLMDNKKTLEDTPITIDFSTAFMDADDEEMFMVNFATDSYILINSVTDANFGEFFDGTTAIRTTSGPVRLTGTTMSVVPAKDCNSQAEALSGFFCAPSFAFQIVDNGGAASKILRINVDVQAVNDAPIATQFKEYRLLSSTASEQTVLFAEDEEIVIIIDGTDIDTLDFELLGKITSFTSADSAATLLTFDQDGNEVTFDSSPFVYSNGFGAALQLRLKTPTNANSFTATGNEEGIYASLQYKIFDGELLSDNEMTLNIVIMPVNDKPVTSRVSETVDEDEELRFSLAASDPENDLYVLNILHFSKPGKGSLFHVVGTTETLVPQEAPSTFSAADGFNFVFRPAANENDVSLYNSFTFFYKEVNNNDNNSNSDISSFFIKVNPVNDAPVLTLFETDVIQEISADSETSPIISGDKVTGFTATRKGSLNPMEENNRAGLNFTIFDQEIAEKRIPITVSVEILNSVGLITIGNKEVDGVTIEGINDDGFATKLVITGLYEKVNSFIQTSLIEINAKLPTGAATQTGSVVIFVSDNKESGACGEEISKSVSQPVTLTCERISSIILELQVISASRNPESNRGTLSIAAGSGAVGAMILAFAAYKMMKKKSDDQELATPWLEEGMDVAVANPMYQDRGMSGNNPFFNN